MPPGALTVEITEGVLLDANPTTVLALGRLREHGCTIDLDDFGTGYSSLSYLRKLPLDVLKLDRSFITGIGDDAGATAIVAAVTRMADTLALSVVAEGVETLSELRALEAIGCQLVQGYFFARPMRLAKLERLLDAPPPWLTRGRPRQEPA
jgi:EAL domain-containing protein (putative c-di-GMP-specific phosphodiesterase class I)